MLSVHRSNRADLLAELLAAQLRLTPPDPFDTVAVVVNTWPTSRWLGEQLAIHLGGVAANLRFPFPGGHLRRLVDLVLEDESPGASDRDPWRARWLVWPVLELLPAIAHGAEGEPLRRWLGGRDPSRRLERPSWELARAIADAFDDYALYRPDLLRAWEQGKPWRDGSDLLPESQRWQPRLYRALRQRLAIEPFGLRVRRAIERLRSGPPTAAARTGPLRLFGLSSLAPVQIELLQALSGTVPVDLFLLTPCRDLWQRCGSRRRRLSDAVALRQPLEADWLLEAPGLEARFGRLGAEFQQLLEGTGEAQLGSWQERDLFLAPATVARQRHPERPPPLLAQLQEQLADPDRVPRLERADDDHSLEFHPCPGPLRMVQIVRDRLLQLLAADPSLEPRDILVMTPQVDRLAPLVAAVFGDADATGVELPWRLTDRSQQSRAGIGRTLLALLELAGERLTASGLERLLECGPLQERFALEPREAGRLTETLQRCGFRWGLDGEERGGDPTHSLAWAIDRLLLGLVLPGIPGLAPADTAPFASGAPLDLSGRWLHLLTRLRHWLGELRRGGDSKDWGGRLRALLDDLFGDGGEAAGELPVVQAAIDDWLEASTGCPLLLEAPVVAALLEEGLAADSGRFGHRSGALTISALEPMRAIPHRVIVLMGLDAGVFPRQGQRPGFHLMERQRRLGDPTPADQDRYVLLEALLSARDHLLVCWSCRDERTGETRQASSSVRQWQQWLESRLAQEAAALTVVHPADPLDPRNFRPLGDRPAASCDRRLFRALHLLAEAPPLPAAGLIGGDMPADLPKPAAPMDPFEDLLGWLMEPQRHWLRQLGLRPGEWDERLEDLEDLELDERQRAALLREVRSLSAEAAIPTPSGADDWLEITRGQGRLPPFSGAELEGRSLHERWWSLKQCLDLLGEGRQERVAWGPWEAGLLRHGDAVVVVHTARESAPQRMNLWLHLLLAAAAAPAAEIPPSRGVLVARDDDRFGPQLQLRAPDPDRARTELERLAELRLQWRTRCWPVPPRTGLVHRSAERKKAGTGPLKAAEAWEGGFGHGGERDREEMVVCFGSDLSFRELLDGDFVARADAVFAPLLDAAVAAEGPS